MSEHSPFDDIIPYGCQTLDEDDIDAVTRVLRSQWLTTGPAIEGFEQAMAEFTQASEAVAVNSGTAALHTAMSILGICPGDEVLVPAMTFAATVNCVLYCGATPVFVDVQPNTLLIDPADLKSKLSSRSKAVITMDYAGQPCDYKEIQEICSAKKLKLVADACHSLGGTYAGRRVGSLADISCFSFHPVKNMTTGEGGLLTTKNVELARKARVFRNHGISTSYQEREKAGTHHYAMEALGFNYRLTDIQAALGVSQLKKLPHFIQARQVIAKRYDNFFATSTHVKPLAIHADRSHAYHLYVVRVEPEVREELFLYLRTNKIGVNVHYIPVYWHPFYAKNLTFEKGLCPIAEQIYQQILSIPIFPGLSESQQMKVCHLIEAFYA